MIEVGTALSVKEWFGVSHYFHLHDGVVADHVLINRLVCKVGVLLCFQERVNSLSSLTREGIGRDTDRDYRVVDCVNAILDRDQLVGSTRIWREQSAKGVVGGSGEGRELSDQEHDLRTGYQNEREWSSEKGGHPPGTLKEQRSRTAGET